ncbi:DUF1648 domain-containing protein [Prescottella soli]|uniref:DUF1648 domain-containing protein n=1 Tax=Prescottella soli TaxID=1543852 RepID=A0ABW9FXJ4_9NOCA
MTTPTPSPRVFDPAGVVFGVVVPMLAAAAGVVLTYVLLPRLPEQIATQWSGDTATSFMSPTGSAWLAGVMVVIVGGGCSGIAALAQAQLMTRRIMLVIGLTVVGLIVAVQIAIPIQQLDMTTPTDAPLPVDAIGAGLAFGAVAGMVGASLLRDYRVRAVATEAPSADLPRSAVELPITDQVGMSASGLIATAMVLAMPAALLCWFADSWWLMGVYLPVVLLTVVLLQFRLVVDADSIRVQNMGMSAIEYGTEEVLGAKVTHLRPFQDFGGWGLKAKGRGNYGVVTRTGPAVVITFACGNQLTVTTARAEEVAGALNTLADRRLARS